MNQLITINKYNNMKFQPPRKSKNYSDIDIKNRFYLINQLKKEYNVSFIEASSVILQLEIQRISELFLSNGDITDENIATGINEPLVKIEKNLSDIDNRLIEISESINNLNQ